MWDIHGPRSLPCLQLPPTSSLLLLLMTQKPGNAGKSLLFSPEDGSPWEMGSPTAPELGAGERGKPSTSGSPHRKIVATCLPSRVDTSSSQHINKMLLNSDHFKRRTFAHATNYSCPTKEDRVIPHKTTSSLTLTPLL